MDQLHGVLAGTTSPRFLIARDGSVLVLESEQANDPTAISHPGMAVTDRFFIVELQLPPAQVNGVANPLAYTTGAGFLALQARILWPYQTALNHPEQASSLVLNFALTP